MKKTIELCAKRPKHKDLVIVFYDTPLGRKALEKEKEKLTRRGYSVTFGPNRPNNKDILTRRTDDTKSY